MIRIEDLPLRLAPLVARGWLAGLQPEAAIAATTPQHPRRRK
jgi:hypothetical protein